MLCISFERSAPLSLKENTKKFFEISIKENPDDSDGVFVAGAASNSISINLSKLDDFEGQHHFIPQFKIY